MFIFDTVFGVFSLILGAYICVKGCHLAFALIRTLFDWLEEKLG